MRLQGLEEPLRPSPLGCGVLVGLVGEPHGVDDDVVGHVASGIGGGLMGYAGDGAAHADIAAYDCGEPAA